MDERDDVMWRRERNARYRKEQHDLALWELSLHMTECMGPLSFLDYVGFYETLMQKESKDVG